MTGYFWGYFKRFQQINRAMLKYVIVQILAVPLIEKLIFPTILPWSATIRRSWHLMRLSARENGFISPQVPCQSPVQWAIASSAGQ